MPLHHQNSCGSSSKRCCLRGGLVTLLALCGYSVTSALPATAQRYDPRAGASPLSIMSAPADPIAYHRTRERARKLLALEWNSYLLIKGEVAPGAAKTAEPLTEKLVRDYPRDPENWLLLATAKRLLNKHAEAAAAYERVVAISGFGNTSAGSDAIKSHLAAGNKRAALDLIRRQIEKGSLVRQLYFTNDDYKALRDEPGFRELVGHPDPSGWSRDQGWAHDLEYVVSEVKRVNPDYRGRAFPAEFVRIHEDLKRNIPTLSDEQILVEMNRMLGALHQGHTQMHGIPTSRMARRLLPIQFHAFPEGLFIVHAAPQYSSLIGSKLVALGKQPAAEVLRKVTDLMSVDADMEYLLRGPHLAALMPVMKGLGVTESNDSIEVTVERSGKRQKMVLDATLDPLSWVRSPPPGYAALYGHRELRSNFEQAVPEHDALYVRFNAVANGKDETLKAFGVRLREVISSKRPKNIVLDMRFNAGGSTALYQELLRTMIGYSLDPGNQIYVLTARGTYSAASNFITELERLGNPIFIGEAPSECCNLSGDATQVTLPYSKVTGNLTAMRWNLSHPYDTRREISPDIPIQLTAKDYFAGRDAVLETTYRLIQEKPGTGAEGLVAR